MKNKIVEKAVYCFKASLQYIDRNDCFEVRFKVLAEDIYKAQTILEEWLKNPKQTGFKFSCCVGIERESSEYIICKQPTSKD